jgi:hypothetical protein
MIQRGVERNAGAAVQRLGKREVPHNEWTEQIPDAEWAIYEQAIVALRPIESQLLLGGAFGLAAYTGNWRNTKDMDIYVRPRDREAMIDALTRVGFKDYYEQVPYVRHWIYRAWKDGCIVDLIWAMANQRAEVDEEWFERAEEIRVRSETLGVVPPEELLWCKLYVLQKDRCDWPDVMTLIHAMEQQIDWDHLVYRLGDDLPLLAGLLNVYCWLCPGGNLNLPQKLKAMVPVCGQSRGPLADACRINWIDSRPWFTPRPNVS